MIDHGHERQCPADGHGPCVTHDELCWVAIIDQEGQQTGNHHETEEANALVLADDEEEKVCRDGDDGQQPIQPVCEIDGVGGTDDDEADGDDEQSNRQVQRDVARNRYVRCDEPCVQQVIEDTSGKAALKKHFGFGRDAIDFGVRFLGVIHKANQCEQKKRGGQQPHIGGRFDTQCGNGANQEHQTAHKRSPAFFLLIRRQLFANGLNQIVRFEQAGLQRDDGSHNQKCRDCWI